MSSRTRVIAAPFAALLLGAVAIAQATQPIRYDRDIRPILSDRCFRCHGPDVGARQAKLRLDTFEDATAPRDDGAAIVPGAPEQSALLARIAHADPDERMPPPDSGRRALSESEIERVRAWIEQGARYEPHWSFVPPEPPALPDVRDASWVRNPIDRFVLAELERRGVQPSAPADRATLLRRAFLDVTGLPPTPEEQDAFAADTRPDAYEQWIARLYTEEPYKTRQAEHRAVAWLDQARYADTCGIHMDAGRQMWLWRDWMLGAYRDNVPFDRFALEQLAGDLLPNASVAQQIASGFNRNHVTTDEGGAIAEEYLVEYAVDRVNTTSSVFLGLTMGCARCHDHKYDPLTQDDYYRFLAYFNSIDEPGLYSQLSDPQRAFEPALVVPTPQQDAELARLKRERTDEQTRVDSPAPDDERAYAEFLDALPRESGIEWIASELAQATSRDGATLTAQSDGSVLASGANPARDEHVLTLRTDATELRVVCLEALTDPSFFEARVGRADNGNAVLSRIEVEARALSGEPRSRKVELEWAWADVEQQNGDFRVVNALDGGGDRGWAVDAHNQPGPRVALFTAREPFGYAGGTELVVRLSYDSVYAQHVFGRVRVSFAKLGDAGLALLPPARSGWYATGPFPESSAQAAYDAHHGPEDGTRLDTTKNFGAGNQMWRYDRELCDARLNSLPAGVNTSYVAQRVFNATPREVETLLGSDDGIRVSVAGVEQFAKQVDRSLSADQDRVKLAYPRGESALVLKIVNTGGQAGFQHRAIPAAEELAGELVGALLPQRALHERLAARVARAWRLQRSPDYRKSVERLAALDADIAKVETARPQTMVMRELAAPRDTFVLMRGQYDKPDPKRKVERGVPRALGELPAGASADRRGLVQWLFSPRNPLVARVAVNRMWESLFGEGLVRTSEDFGLQGEWPSHPELLDWLALEFRASGWNQQHMLRLMLASNTYRQSSRARADLQERDPDNRWLARAPRRRLSAEALRDQALYVSGLLVESLGGPSVKTYQPEGLWQEIAMPSSNTRIYERGSGEALWRRSLYTYWKRACPPPSLLSLDAPTREFCTIKRPTTNTPLQALVLWNDEQFVEAARALAARVLADAPVASTAATASTAAVAAVARVEPVAPERASDRPLDSDAARIAALFRRCTSRAPDERELAALRAGLARFRERWSTDRDAAKRLLEVGEAPLPMLGADATLDERELAAWTWLASAVLNLDAALCKS